MTATRPVSRQNDPARSTLVDLSVVLPCYRAAELARKSVVELSLFLRDQALSWEIIVVDDGGGDFGEVPLSRDPRVRLLVLKQNVGKGGAVAAGMLAARGRARVFTDIDLPYDLHLIPAAANYILEGPFHIVIGDRTMPTARYAADIHWKRRIASRLFSIFVGTMVTGGFFDTQCGLKAVRGDVADVLFSLSRLRRFAFDVELVYLGLHHRLDIKRIPVQLRNDGASSIRIIRDSARMFVDVLRIKYFQSRGYYVSEQLSAVVVDDFAARLAATHRAEDERRSALRGSSGVVADTAQSASAHTGTPSPFG